MTIHASHFSQLTTLPTNPFKLHKRPTSPTDETRLQYLVQVSIGLSMPNLKGVEITWTENGVTTKGPSHDSSVRKHLCAININMNKMPDVAMTLAVVALFADGPTAIRDVGSWRVKETERMIVVCTELRQLGETVKEGPDYGIITPPEKLNVTAVDTYDDHRPWPFLSLLVQTFHIPGALAIPSLTTLVFLPHFPSSDQPLLHSKYVSVHASRLLC
ncbi:UNVERIFIED_CONTAM: 3-phosphoshikimate 1-carboxyvinyltransferase 2 [Sesamum angustifolium]|uniref:3-phosphoshikimate 1-carboxyvinyltransferase n=1 Tax=Sesamum angustifolium TaxID=2727405 RepID=A0AAW2NA20_9LAMI